MTDKHTANKHCRKKYRTNTIFINFNDTIKSKTKYKNLYMTVVDQNKKGSVKLTRPVFFEKAVATHYYASSLHRRAR